MELALDEVMKDKKYAMLLKTKLGASTVEEVRAEVKKQLVNDPTFMNSVRAQVKTAADEASKGVSQGWSDQKVLDRLQANLLPISGLVANKIDELGSSAGNIADNKVDDTVHKFLPASWETGSAIRWATRSTTLSRTRSMIWAARSPTSLIPLSSSSPAVSTSMVISRS